MYVPAFQVNQVVINAVIVEFTPAEVGGYVLVRQGDNTFYIFADYAPTWEEVSAFPVGTQVEFLCAIQSDGHNDSFVLQRFNVNGGYATLAGYVANPQLKEAAGKRLMEFAIRVPNKGQNGEDLTRFYRASCWNEKLFSKILKGAFVAITGNARIRYYQHNGEDRSSVDVVVNHVATPFVTTNGNGAVGVPAIPGKKPPVPTPVGANSNPIPNQAAAEDIDF